MHTRLIEALREAAPRLDLLMDVARVTRAVPAMRFKMTAWWTEYAGCGTAGCAIGHWCAANPRAALRLAKVGGAEVPTPICGGERFYRAIGLFFGIAENDALYLFSATQYHPEAHHRPAEVANRIERWVRERRPAVPLVIEMKPERAELVTA